MADQDVNIIGFDGLTPPLWATEETLSEMLKQIEKLVDMSGQQKKDLKQAIRGGGGGKGGKTDPKKVESMFDAMSDGLKSSAKSAAESAAGFDKLPGPLSGLGKALKKTTGATKLAAIGIGIIANQAGKAISSIKESVSTLRDLSDSGIRIQGSFMEVQRSLAETGMTIGEFGEMTAKYSNVINRYGMPAMSELANEVNEAGDGFSKWGLKLSEGTEIAAELIDQQRRAGLFGEIDSQKQSKHIADVMDKLTAYSKVLNVSRKEMLEHSKAVMSDAEVQFRISQLDEEGRKKMDRGLQGTALAVGSLGDDFDFMMQVIKETAVNKIDTQSVAYTEMMASGYADLANALAEVGNASAEGVVHTQEQILAIAAEAKARKNHQEAMFMGSDATRAMAIKVGAAGVKTDQAAAQSAENAKRGDKTYQESVDSNVQLMTELDTSLSVLQASIEYTRVHGFMALMGDGAEGGIKAAIEGINTMSDALMKFNDSGAMEDMGAWIRDNWTTALAGGALAVVGFSKVFGVVGKGLGAVLSKVSMRALGAAGAAAYGVQQAWQAVTTGKSDVSELINSSGIGMSFMDKLGSGMQHVESLWSQDARDNIAMTNGTGVIDHNSDAQKEIRQQRRDDYAAAQAKKQADQASTTVSTPPAKAAAPTMSAADIAKLDQASQTNYYLAELLKTNKKTGRMLAGEI